MKRIAALVTICWLFSGHPAVAGTASARLQGDGSIRLFNYHLNEFAEIQFRKGENIDPEAIERINHLLRSRDSNKQTPIAMALIDLIDYLQDKFGADTIEIISAYRSPEFNASLLRNGHTVSPESLHMSGRALDIHIDEIREETLRDYLVSLHMGGVGYYGPFDFIHIDVGPVRHWGEKPSRKRKLIGVLQPDAARQLISDHNDYLLGMTLHFSWQGSEDSAFNRIQDFRLQHFHRGQWKTVAKGTRQQIHGNFVLPFADKIFCKPNGMIRYGKYRWTFRLLGQEKLNSSNEFYLKKA